MIGHFIPRPPSLVPCEKRGSQVSEKSWRNVFVVYHLDDIPNVVQSALQEHLRPILLAMGVGVEVAIERFVVGILSSCAQ